MSFGQFITILRARRWIALAVLLTTVGLTIVISLVLPKQYTSSASVVLDFKPDPVTAMLYAGAPSPGLMATQVDVIQSDRVALRVVRDLKFAENPQVRDQWLEATGGQGDIETWLAANFQKSLDVKPSRESNVITISYKAPDPRFSSALANAFVQAYLETSVELRVDPAKQYSAFFDIRSKEAREVLERAQSRLSAFQKEKGIIASDERLDDENQRLAELTSQSVLLQTLAAESRSRQIQAQGGSSDKMQEVLNNPLIAGLKSDLSRSEARLQELSARLGENNPQVVEAKANIASTRQRIESETRRITGSVGLTDTITRQREAEIKAATEAQRAKVLRLKAIKDEGAVLMRDVESAQAAYQAVVSRFNQSNLESQTTQSNINVLTSAVPPLLPSSPKLLLNSLLSVVVGLLLSIGVALVLEIRDRRVRSLDDISTVLGLAVIGVLPKPGARRFIGGRRPSLTHERMVGRLVAPGKGI